MRGQEDARRVAGVEEAGVRQREGGGCGEVVKRPGEPGEAALSCLEGRSCLSSSCGASCLEGGSCLGRSCGGALGLDLLAVLGVEQLERGVE